MGSWRILLAWDVTVIRLLLFSTNIYFSFIIIVNPMPLTVFSWYVSILLASLLIQIRPMWSLELLTRVSLFAFMQTLSWVILIICQQTVCRDQGDVQVGLLRDPSHLGPRCRPLGLPLDQGWLPDHRPQMPVVFSLFFPNSPSCPSFSASYSAFIFPGSFSAFSGTARALWAVKLCGPRASTPLRVSGRG